MMTRNIFYALGFIIVVFTDTIIWLRFAKSSPKQKSNQMLGGITFAFVAVLMLVLWIFGGN